MSSPYTIRIFVPEGDPNGLRIIENMNWTGAEYGVRPYHGLRRN